MVEEALNRGNLSVVDELLTQDFVYHGPNGEEARCSAGYKQFLNRLRTYYPDILITIENILAEGDLVATRAISVFTSKSSGPDPIVRKITLASSILDRFEGDKIEKHGKYTTGWTFFSS